MKLRVRRLQFEASEMLKATINDLICEFAFNFHYKNAVIELAYEYANDKFVKVNFPDLFIYE